MVRANTFSRSVWALVGVSMPALGCSGDDTDMAPANHEHVYALQSTVVLPDDTTLSYVALTDELDVSGELTLADAREFAGYSFITNIGGKLLVSSGEEPAITQYEIGAGFDWHEAAKLSFVGVGVDSFGAGFERHWLLNEHTAYLTLDVTSRVVWDPTAMEILDVRDDTQLEATVDGLSLDATFNRPPQLLKGPVLKPFYYRDDDWFRFGPSTPIAVYDPETHRERAVLDVPCPALEVASQDEAGNTYFSPWTYGPTLALFGAGPDTCIRRIDSSSELDADWQPDLRAWTGGRPVHVFRYLSDGKAFGTVLHVDEVQADFTAGYDEELAGELDRHWKLWLFDLHDETARPVEGIDHVASGFNMTKLDDRVFVFVPNDDWSASTVYEVDSDGRAEARFDVDGVVNNWIKLR